MLHSVRRPAFPQHIRVGKARETVNMDRLGDFIQDIARGAGRIQIERRNAFGETRSKSGRGDFVTEVNEACERYLMDAIAKERPAASILSEESGASGRQDAEEVWIMDPLDGTRNYVEGIPFFCVSIGMVRSGRAEAGAIYDPVHDEMFYARRGAGAFVNGAPIRVSDDESIDDGIISVAWVKRKAERSDFVSYIDEISSDTSYFRRYGSAALAMAYVACGRSDGYLQGGLNPWDVAAGVVIIEEAGGVVTDFDGKTLDLFNPDIELVTANPAIHSVLLNGVIRKCRE
jgi:myo-inositol-1(or 4)-monophosphatase